MKEPRKKKKPGEVDSFRIEDEAVAQILYEADNKNQTINEAIRRYGGKAAIDVLRSEADILLGKIASAQKADESRETKRKRIQERIRRRKERSE